jgi:hypothetical protein
VIVIVVSSALLIACLSGCDLTSMCVVVCVEWLTMDAPSAGFSVFWEPSVYMSLCGFHAAWNGLMGYLVLWRVLLGVSG